jgi:hypothetical protein
MPALTYSRKFSWVWPPMPPVAVIVVVGCSSVDTTFALPVLFTSTEGTFRTFVSRRVWRAYKSTGSEKSSPFRMPAVTPIGGVPFAPFGIRTSGTPSPSVSWKVDMPKLVTPKLPIPEPGRSAPPSSTPRSSESCPVSSMSAVSISTWSWRLSSCRIRS